MSDSEEEERERRIVPQPTVRPERGPALDLSGRDLSDLAAHWRAVHAARTANLAHNARLESLGGLLEALPVIRYVPLL
jgi:hypothetical protein